MNSYMVTREVFNKCTIINAYISKRIKEIARGIVFDMPLKLALELVSGVFMDASGVHYNELIERRNVWINEYRDFVHTATDIEDATILLFAAINTRELRDTVWKKAVEICGGKTESEVSVEALTEAVIQCIHSSSMSMLIEPTPTSVENLIRVASTY